MKKLFISLVVAVSAIFSNSLVAQSSSFSAKVSQITSTHKDGEKVIDDVITLDENNSASVNYTFPKGKYVMFVISDSNAFSEVSFSIKGDSMEWETIDKSQRQIVKEGKGFKAKKFIVSNPIVVSNNVGELNFKIDNLNALLNNMNAKQQANYSAQTNANINAMSTRGQVNTGSARWNKQSNVSELTLNITTDSSNIKDKKGNIRILVYEK